MTTLPRPETKKDVQQPGQDDNAPQNCDYKRFAKKQVSLAANMVIKAATVERLKPQVRVTTYKPRRSTHGKIALTHQNDAKEENRRDNDKA